MHLNFQRIPFVKEWGSWAIFIYSCSAGLVVGLLTRPWETGNDYSIRTLAAILGLVFLVNSKASFSAVLRAGEKRRESLGWFLFFCLTGLALLIPFLINGINILLAAFLLVAIYLVFVTSGKEHYLLAELNGFALLTLSAPIIYFVITGDVSWKLYIAVLTYFAAGVLKVRVRVKKTVPYRILMVLYCATACALFYLLHIAVIILLPFIENITTSIWMREEKLKTTGYTELVKGMIFIILIWLFW